MPRRPRPPAWSAEPWAWAVAAAAIVALVGVLHWGLPFLTDARSVVSSTPAPPPVSAHVVTPVPLAAGAEVCLAPVTLSPDGRIAAFLATKGLGRHEGPALELRISAPGYRARAVHAGGYGSGKFGEVRFAVTPPSRSVQGRACLRNVGRRTLPLVGSTEPHTDSRPKDTLAGAPIVAKVALTFYAGKRTPLLDRAGAVLEHAAAFRPGIVSPGLLGVVAVLLLILLPAATIGGLVRALRRS